jgi:hypothetical protein
MTTLAHFALSHPMLVLAVFWLVMAPLADLLGENQ